MSGHCLKIARKFPGSRPLEHIDWIEEYLELLLDCSDNLHCSQGVPTQSNKVSVSIHELDGEDLGVKFAYCFDQPIECIRGNPIIHNTTSRAKRQRRLRM